MSQRRNKGVENRTAKKKISANVIKRLSVRRKKRGD
jgi:hypothetical protein